MPSSDRTTRLVETETLLSGEFGLLNKSQTLGEALGSLENMRKHIVSLYNIFGSKADMLQLIKSSLMPAIASTMCRFGVALRDEDNTIHVPSTMPEMVSLVGLAITQENKYFEAVVVPKFPDNTLPRSFYHDLVGIEAYIGYAKQADREGNQPEALKQLKDTLALCSRAVIRELQAESIDLAHGNTPAKVALR